jgi:hypothetical protein
MLTLCAQALATWSIVIVNTRTGEVCVASATCLPNFNLRKATPVLIPGVGVAAAQSYLDGIGNRLVIHDQMLLGTDPDDILAIIDARDTQLRLRQYGMVDLQGRALTFTGSGAGAWAGGVTGQVGDLVYAIQGNVLTGQPVVDDAEAAILNTPGDLAEKVMAAMEAAHLAGGDGRCSCSPTQPDGCGAPPPNFTHSAYCAYFLVARPGDPKKDCDMNLGCGRGAFYMGLNIKNLGPNDPEPIGLLRQEYDAWRIAKQGLADSVHSLVIPQTKRVLPGSGTVRYDIELYDIDGVSLTVGGATISLEHQSDSAGLASIQNVIDHQDGSYSVDVMPGSTPGLDHFAFRVDDGLGGYQPLLWPPQTLLHETPVHAAPLLSASLTPGLPQLDLQDAFVHRDGQRAWVTAASQVTGKMSLQRVARPQPGAAFAGAVDVAIAGTPAGRLREFCLSEDELQLFFSATDPSDGIMRLHEARRASTAVDFDTPRRLDELNSDTEDRAPWLSENGMELYFVSHRNGFGELMLATRRGPDAHWFAPQSIPGIPQHVLSVVQAEGDLRLIYARSGGNEPLTSALRDENRVWTHQGIYPGVDVRIPAHLTGASLQEQEIYLRRAKNPNGHHYSVPLAVDSLRASLTELSAAAGGTLSYELDAGPDFANARYEVLVGEAGDSAFYKNLSLPFTHTMITDRVRALAGSGKYSSMRGVLDGNGRAQFVLTASPGELDRPGIVNRPLRLCFVSDDRNGMRMVSNAQSLLILP